MPTDTSEKGLETIITNYLRDVQGYEQGVSDDYEKAYALDCNRVERFLMATQPKKVESTACFASSTERNKFFNRLRDEITKRGISDVLRKGFKYISEIFDMYYPLPNELNPTAKKLYSENIFCITRQLHFSKANPNLSVDLMLSLNGLPIATFELKNHYTNQTVENAVHQYQTDRDPKDLLFAFKRCAVHFAVDDDDIKMCTKLEGKKSWFLPFNKGCKGGAGNPLNPNGLRTSYLWESILEKRSLSDILENYAQLVIKEDKKTHKKKESVVWPRYHQLDCVRKLLKDTREKGLGKRYLIQHSAGSGKSNSITWLAYQLVNIFNDNKPLMDSVIVVTDRVNLDTQIRDNIRAFKKLSNIVDWADSASTLKDALQGGKKIIITTVHKFPFIVESIGSEMKNKNFAIIIDEAHSSQSGKLSSKMNIALSGNGDENDDYTEDTINEIIRRQIEGRKMLKNANYYAFTATPKNKTLQMFGERIDRGEEEPEFVPYHEYTMKQAIEEGFIEDVLAHYTPYNSYYKIMSKGAESPEFDKKQAMKKLRCFVEAQPETIEQKSAIIVEHFHEKVINKGKIGGKARAMVVTSSIKRAIDFYYEITSLLEKRQSPYKAIVAFSGEKLYGGQMLDEAKINGFPSKEIEEKMEEEPYRLLIVADKFQTGYDQPLLHTMYVDKMLCDVQAVQTLSRLNRCHPDKKDTFVLDFANDPSDIQKAFQRYYKGTVLVGETDPNKLNDLTDVIEEANFYSEDDVEQVNLLYWGNQDREKIDTIINPCVDRFKTLKDETKASVKKSIKLFIRTYAYLSAILPFKSENWEKLNTFYMLLLPKLPKLQFEDLAADLLKYVDFDQYRSISQGETKIELENKEGEVAPIPVSTKGGIQQPEMDTLDNIIEEFNELFGGIEWEYPDTVKKQIKTLPEKLAQSTAFVNAANNSDENTAEIQSNEDLQNIIMDLMDESTEFARQYFQNQTFRTFINQKVFREAYKNVK